MYRCLCLVVCLLTVHGILHRNGIAGDILDGFFHAVGIASRDIEFKNVLLVAFLVGYLVEVFANGVLAYGLARGLIHHLEGQVSLLLFLGQVSVEGLLDDQLANVPGVLVSHLHSFIL